MSSEQWRVLILLIFLLGLEIVRSQQLRTFFSQIYLGFSTPATHPGIAGTQPSSSSNVPTVQGTPPQPSGTTSAKPPGAYKPF